MPFCSCCRTDRPVESFGTFRTCNSCRARRRARFAQGQAANKRIALEGPLLQQNRGASSVARPSAVVYRPTIAPSIPLDRNDPLLSAYRDPCSRGASRASSDLTQTPPTPASSADIDILHAGLNRFIEDAPTAVDETSEAHDFGVFEEHVEPLYLGEPGDDTLASASLPSIHLSALRLSPDGSLQPTRPRVSQPVAVPVRTEDLPVPEVPARRSAAWLAFRGARVELPRGYRSQVDRNLCAHSLGRRSALCSKCNALHWIQERTLQSSLRSPSFQTCCRDGAVVLPMTPPPPPYLEKLFTDQDAASREFRTNVRDYNTAFAFTSFRYGIDDRVRGGLRSFSVHGEVYHCTGPLGSHVRCFAATYFLDPDDALNARSARAGVRREIAANIQTILSAVNPFIMYYRTAWDVLQQSHREEGLASVIITPQFRLVLEQGTDKRRFNLPTVSEPAIVIPDEYSDHCFRDVILCARNADGTIREAFSTISRFHGAYLPLHYVLFYPYGNPGYRWGLKYNRPIRGDATGPEIAEQEGDDIEGSQDPDSGDWRRRRPNFGLSQRCWYRYQIFERVNAISREPQFNALTYGQRLFQQWLCDAYACVDQTVLEWHNRNQEKVRADLYSGVMDALNSDLEQAPDLGRPVILNSTYLGSDRFMSKCYQNAMAITRTLGKPTLFITFTANPQWAEIAAELHPGEQPHHRPELIAIVFKLKLDALLKEIKQKKGIFGSAIGTVYTIEYQKRGLPHAHLLVFLHPQDIPASAEEVDEIVSAQLPLDNPELAAIVRRVLTHGPCGPGTNSPCMQDGRCTKGYPKDFCELTVLRDDSYPIYARPNNGVKWTDRGFEFDNRWVVPYNTYLTKKYNAHINVEVARGIYSIKYLAKYIYKGVDRATLAVEDRNNEIKLTLNGRYISPVQAVWRLLAYTTHEEKPPVYLLDYHLEGRHRVTFNRNLSAQELEAEVRSQSSMFLDWMAYNASHLDGRDLLYVDFPLFYTYNRDKSAHGWHPRKKGSAIGRMHVANPRQGEHFYLRLLLCYKAGVRSYSDLYKVHGIQYSSPSEACRALGLTFDDSEWIALFNELRHTTTASSLRQTLAVALAQSAIIDPQAIWDTFAETFCDDVQRRLQRLSHRLQLPDNMSLAEQTIDYGLWLLGDNLRALGLTFAEVRLQGPVHQWGIRPSNPLLAEATDFDALYEYEALETNLATLSPSQLNAYSTIIKAIENDPASAHFFLQGPAGTGKTFLYQTLCSYFRSLGKIVICVASSGIASLLLPGGSTSHSRFKIPLKGDRNSLCAFTKQSYTADLIRRVSLIIWDEVSLQNKLNFYAVDNSLRDLMDCDSLFGGIPAILGGDFAQILPVVKQGNRASIVGACIQNWDRWREFRLLYLTENMRIVEGDGNKRFANWLADLSYNPVLYGPIDLPPWIRTTKSRPDFIEAIYPRHIVRRARPKFFSDRAILTSRNVMVDTLNSAVLDLTEARSRTYYSKDRVAEGESYVNTTYTQEYLHSIIADGLPPGSITLKVGTPVMLIRNYYPKEGLCNGTRLIITQLFNHCVKARIVSQDARFHDKEHVISRIEISSDDLTFPLYRKQLPLRVCYAMTINKSQGQTLEYVGVDLSGPVFSHGQLYVAMSRVTDVSNLIVLLPDNPTVTRTQNIVYPEVLLRPPRREGRLAEA